MKRGKRKYAVLSTIGLTLLIVLFLGVVALNNLEKLPDNVQESLKENPLVNAIIDDHPTQDQPINSPSTTTSGQDTTTSTGGGGSGSSQGDAQSSSQTNPQSTCSTQQISYSVGSINKTQTCLEYAGEECIQKEITCLTRVTNLDPEVSGSFTLQFTYFEEDKNVNEFFAQETAQATIGPEQSVKMSASTTTTNQAIANKNINCFYQTIHVPQKEVCDL